MSTRRATSHRSSLTAIDEAKQSTLAEPTHPGTWLQLADAYEQANQFEPALEAVQNAVQLAPSLAAGHILLGKIELRLGRAQALTTLQRALKGGLSQVLQVEANTLIAEHYLTLHKHQQAYKHYVIANRIRANMPSVRQLREEPGLLHPHALAGVEAWAQLVTTHPLHTWPRVPSSSVDEPQDPVFIIGFPHSGAALLGRMLAERPNPVTWRDQATIEPTIQSLSANPTTLPDLGQRTTDDLVAARKLYWHHMQQCLGDPLAPHTRIVDNTRLNILWVPVLARLFPNSHFILALRDPRDACLSCFMENFRPTPATATFVDLEATARYHRACFSVLHAAESKLALSMTTVRYEELATKPEDILQEIVSRIQPTGPGTARADHPPSGQNNAHMPSAIQAAEHIYQPADGHWQYYPEAVKLMQPWLNLTLKQYGYREHLETTDASIPATRAS